MGSGSPFHCRPWQTCLESHSSYLWSCLLLHLVGFLGPSWLQFPLLDNYRTTSTIYCHTSLPLLLCGCAPSVGPLPMPGSLTAPGSPSLMGKFCFSAPRQLESLYDFSTFPVTADTLTLSRQIFPLNLSVPLDF